MIQLQYLHFATAGGLGMEQAIENKMLEGVYSKAFEAFLTFAEIERPSSIDHPSIAVFLLICDIAINPGSGFPFPLVHYETYIHDSDPSARFVTLYRFARLKCPEVLTLIHEYSREEYQEASEKLCAAILERSPLEIAGEFERWAGSSEFAPLMAEHRDYKFGKANVVARIIFSHFLVFMRDKFTRPEFFCWPGVHMAGPKVSADTMPLFDRHGALFVDKEDDDGIFPRIQLGRSEEDIQEAFDNFYAHNVIFDLTRQWIIEPGPFRYDYRWLSQKGSDVDIQRFAERSFESVYGVNPSDVTVL